MKNSLSTPRFPPSASIAAKVAAIYLAVGVLWILFSDAALGLVVRDPSAMAKLAMAKGCFYVAITALMLYFLVKRGTAQINRDLAELKQTEQALQEREEALRCANRELRAISDCNQVLLRATDEQSLLREICRIVCEEAGYRVAWVGYAEHDEAKSVRPIASTGVEEGYLARLDITWADTERGCGPCGTAIRTGKTSCLEDYATDPSGAPWKQMASQHSFRSAIGLPLKDEQANTFGSLNIYSAQPKAFTSEETRLLEELAGDLAFGIVTLRSRTARERAEQKVSLLNFALDRVHEAAFLIDEQGLCQYANESASRILGYNRAEVLGMCVADLDPDFPAERWPGHWRELKEQQTLTFESRHRTRPGHVFPVEVSANYFEYEGRGYNLALVRDITERKRAEEALRRTAGYLAETQRLTHTGTFVSDETTKPLYWSEELFRIFGFDPQHGFPAKEEPLQRVHPEDLNKFTQAWQRAIHDKVDADVEYRIVLPDGTIKHVYGIGHPVLNANGELVEIVGTTVDITERKRTEEELRKHREHLEELVKQRTEELAVLNQLVYGSLEAAEVGAWWIDFREPDTCHALDNTARMLGWQPDPTGKKTYKLGDWNRLLVDTSAAFPEYAAIIEESHERFAGAVAGKYENYRAVYPLALPDGSLKWIDGRSEIAKRDEYGKAQLMTGTFIDVTRSKRAEADLAEAKARAEAANRAKSSFLANMSHELRTPLNAVLGFSRLLKNDPEVTPQQRETLDIIVRSGEHLLNLINNVLDMAKIESGQVGLKQSEVDLHRLLHEMQSLMGAGAVEKGLRFALELDPDLPRSVAVDAGKLRQVLLNLLGNAIKYTDSGGVKLRARLASIHGAEEAKVRFEVEDSGRGISPEDCQRIFSPFVQLGDQTPAQAGTGLGLSICKQYVELMGGRIAVASKPGKGAVFYFIIPVRILPSLPERDELKHRRILGLAEGQPRYRLLIVEDQPENRLLLRRILTPLGFELREAANGLEAVALFEQWHPDLIWMDIRMPVMDGLEAVRRVRATQAGAGIKVIALTAHALDEESVPIMAAGCDGLVRKPFHEQELFEALAQHLHLKFVYEMASPHESTEEAPEVAVRPEQLDALPAELRQELRQAVIELDTARTQALIEQVTERDAALGRTMNTLAGQLDYKRLLKLLETI
jgi:PAS domain S-box-containing protein